MKISFVLIISLLPSLLFGADQPSLTNGIENQKLKIQLTEKELTWLDTHKRIRIGIDANYAPYSFRDTKGRYIGVVPDFIELVSRLTGISFEIVPDLKWSELLERAKNRHLDVITPANRTMERESFLNFTDAIINTPLVIMTRKDDKRIKIAGDLAGRKIALVRGYSSSDRVIADHPSITRHMVDTPLDGLYAVSVGEADAYVGVIGVNDYIIRQHGLLNLKITARYVREDSGQSFGVRKDWPELASILDKALKAISKMDNLAILNKWVPVEAKWYSPGKLVELTDEERAWLEENPVIELHTADDAPPYEYVGQDGQVQGILKDYAKALEDRLGIRLHLIPHGGKEYFDLIEQGSIKLVGFDAFRTHETPGYLHSKRAVQTHFSLFAKGPEPVSLDIASLKGTTIGVISGLWNGMDFFEQLKEKNRIVEMDTTAEFVNGLISGELDYGMEAQGVILSYLSSTQRKDIKVVYTVPTPIDGGFMVNQDSPLLLTALNKAIADIESSELSTILSKWYDADIQMPLTLSNEEKAWLKEHPQIRVAIDPHWAPVEFKDKTGKFQGMSEDYLSLLEKSLGVRFEPVLDLSWQELVEAVRNKKLDMFASVSHTPERESFSIFTKPYVSMPIRIFSHKDISYVGNLDNLTGKRVTVVQDYAIEEWLRNDHPELELLPVSSPSEGLKRVSEKDADAFIGNVITATYYINKLDLDDIRTGGDTPYANNQAMAVRSDWPILAGILEKALNAIPDQQHEAIFNRWMSLRFEHTTDYRMLWQIALVATTLILVILYWTRRLKLEIGQRIQAEGDLREYQSTLELRVEERTAELESSETLVRKILESTGSGVFGIDHKGIQTFANDAGAMMLGYSMEELIGFPSHETWHHHHTDGTPYPDRDCPIKETLVNGRDSSGEEWFVRKDGSFVPVDFTSSPIMENGEITGAVISFMDISERHHLESIKKSIVKGTSSMVGEAFMHELVENLAQALDMRYAFIGEVDSNLKKVWTIAVWANGERGNNFEYDLAHTPCENVIGKDLCCYPSGIQERFPEDKLLVTMQAESYIGDPLFDSNGNPLGILAVLDDKPLADENLVRSIVSLFAGRAGAELERVIAHRKIETSLEQTVHAIAHTVEQRDPYTSGHQQRVAELAMAIAKEMGLGSDMIEGVRLGGAMHDIGNIYIPTDILHRPSKLTDIEFNIIKAHPSVGHDIIKDVTFSWPIAEIILQHHERLDGSGYPNGLEDGEILLEARILAVADVVEAINSHRPYRPSLGIESALDEITKHRGILYDPDVVDACLLLFKEGRFSW